MSKSDHIAGHYTQRWNESVEAGNKQYVPEKYQLGIIADFLKQHNIKFITEGQVFCYPIDILCTKGETTIAIEMKSKNVSRGIEQARRDADFVDYAFLAVWDHQITDELIQSVEDLPIGLMSVGERVNVVSGPSKTAQQLYRSDDIVELVNQDVRNNSSVQESQ